MTIFPELFQTGNHHIRSTALYVRVQLHQVIRFNVIVCIYEGNVLPSRSCKADIPRTGYTTVWNMLDAESLILRGKLIANLTG